MANQLRYGMVGGGPGAAIGDKHRQALALEGRAKPAAGCFSRSLEKTLALGEELRLSPDRCYATYEEMAKSEASREDGIDFVVVVTPNHNHFDACKTFLEHGIHVVCDKPVTVTYEQALELQALAETKGLLFMVTYTYMGHEAAREIRKLIAEGGIGDVRIVKAEFSQGWLADADKPLAKRHIWRLDPALSGDTNCLGDLGTHVENAASTLSGLKPRRVLAKMDVIVPGRVLDDNDVVLVEYENGATGMYWCSQVAIGVTGGLKVRIIGSKGSVYWTIEEGDRFTLSDAEGNTQVIVKGYGDIDDAALAHPEWLTGYPKLWFKAQANLYRNYIDCLLAKQDGTFTPEMIDFPTIDAGVQGMAFIEACLQSSRNHNTWMALPD